MRTLIRSHSRIQKLASVHSLCMGNGSTVTPTFRADPEWSFPPSWRINFPHSPSSSLPYPLLLLVSFPLLHFSPHLLHSPPLLVSSPRLLPSPLMKII